MEQNPDQDMLGELFMALGLANEWKGQFFTCLLYTSVGHTVYHLRCLLLKKSSLDLF